MAVVIVSTGGTIAAVPDDGGGASPSLTGSDLVDSVPGLDRYGPIRTDQFLNVPSAHFQVRDVVDLVDRLEELAGEDDVDGIVVTQGTDVLEESSFLTSLCYDGEVPVVFTGAMRNPSLPGADGPANLLASATVAADDRASGVLVVFNDRVHDPADVTKVHSMNPDTFRSPEFGPLATVDESRVYWRRETVSEAGPYSIDPETVTNEVATVLTTMGMPARQVRAHADAEAVCLATTGAGHIPTEIIPALEALRDDEVPIVVTTRCPEGRLARDTYGFEGSEQTLQALGCRYSSYNLQKTRIATIVGLGSGRLDEMFQSIS